MRSGSTWVLSLDKKGRLQSVGGADDGSTADADDQTGAAATAGAADNPAAMGRWIPAVMGVIRSRSAANSVHRQQRCVLQMHAA
jgi:hypothetical protein